MGEKRSTASCVLPYTSFLPYHFLCALQQNTAGSRLLYLLNIYMTIQCLDSLILFVGLYICKYVVVEIYLGYKFLNQSIFICHCVININYYHNQN